jgi:hypothetical protein
MAYDHLDDEQYGLLFDVRRSARYHDRRRAFFERMHQVTSGLTILLSGSVIFDLARPGDTPGWMLSIAIVAALLAAWDMVVGYSRMADRHRDLRARWCSLEIDMLKGGVTADEWSAYRVRRLEIEKDEPPIYRALDILCHNELLVADDHGKPGEPAGWFRLSAWQRATSQLFRWHNIAA